MFPQTPLNPLEIEILQDVIFDHVKMVEVRHLRATCFNDVHTDGSIEVLQANPENVGEYIKDLGWECQLCDTMIEDPVKHLLEHHIDHLRNIILSNPDKYLD